MSLDPTHGEFGPPTRIINHVPLEDMRELWYWGVWKEPTPFPFKTSVLVVCTSRQACRRYLNGQTHDHWWLEEDELPAKVPLTGTDDEIFDDGKRDTGSKRRFK